MLAILVAVVLLLSRGDAVRSVATVQAGAAPITLPVTVLPTTYGLLEGDPPTYPANITLILPRRVDLAAYGAAGYVWLAPQRWTGNAAVGADGSILVRLFPIGSSPNSGPAIVYSAEVGCAGCKIADAAPYFPAAMKASIDDGPIPISRGLHVRRVSRTLVTYTLPDENSMQIRGSAFYDSVDYKPFEEVRLKLAPTDAAVSAFLLKYFAEHRITDQWRQ